MNIEELAPKPRLAAARLARSDATFASPESIAGPELEQESRLAATIDQAGIGIAEIDADGQLLRANKHLCSLMGCAQQDLLGRCIFDMTHPDDARADRAQYQRQVAGEIEGYTLKKRFLRADQGVYLWVLITSRSVRDAEGRFLYAVRVQQDITERQQAQEALARHLEEQAALHQLTASLQRATLLEDVYDAAMDAIFRALRCDRAAILLFDAAHVMRFVSWRRLSDEYRRAVEGHSPWQPDTQDPQPLAFDDIAASDLPEALKQRVLQEGIHALAFLPLMEGDRLLGKFMLYYDRPHAFSNADIAIATTIGRHVGFSVQRTRAELAALQLAAIVESSDDAIVSKDLNGIIATWNQGAERLFGYKANEIIGKPVTLLIPAGRLDEEPQILDRIKRGERVDHYETVRRRKDGSTCDVSLTISPIKDGRGNIIGASKIARDISDRKAAEANVRESERRLQELIAAIPAAIYTTDAEGRITYFNEAAVELAGRTPVIGSDEWCVTWKLYWPDGTPLPHEECPMAVALKEGRAIRNVEAVAERPDGTRVPFIPYPTPLRDGNGKIVGAINMLVDVSERKEAETQQRILLNELNHRVKNNMQMLQSLLLAAVQQTKSEDARRVLHEASARISAMAAAQRVLYGSTGATRFSAHEFVNAVCETARQTFPPGIEIVCNAGSDELQNDTAMPLALILNELLTNAVKYGVNGSKSGQIRVALNKQDEGFRLAVEDDGPGFELEEVRERASGLRLVQGLARQLRGRLTVDKVSGFRCSVEFLQGDPL